MQKNKKKDIDKTFTNIVGEGEMKREYVSMSNSWIPLRFALEDLSPMSDIPSNVEEAIVHYREFVKKERV